MRAVVAVAVVSLAFVGCENRTKQAVETVDHDAEYISKASGAVNEVVRNQTDCAAARPLIPEAYQLIDEAREAVSAPATQQTLDALEAQVDRVDQLCP